MTPSSPPSHIQYLNSSSNFKFVLISDIVSSNPPSVVSSNPPDFEMIHLRISFIPQDDHVQDGVSGDKET